jgi:hypothetical protein
MKSTDMDFILYDSVRHGNITDAKRAIEMGADVNYVYEPEVYGLTPLHIAAYYAQDNIIKLLIDSGCEINPVSVDGKTPLALAEERHNRESTIELLKGSGASDFCVPIPDFAKIGDVFLTNKNEYLLVQSDGTLKKYDCGNFELLEQDRNKLENLDKKVDIVFTEGKYQNAGVYYSFEPVFNDSQKKSDLGSQKDCIDNQQQQHQHQRRMRR